MVEHAGTLSQMGFLLSSLSASRVTGMKVIKNLPKPLNKFTGF